MGEAAQRALEHALKAVSAAWGHPYPHIHDLDELLTEVHKPVPDLALRARLDLLSLFAARELYDTPGLSVRADEVRADMHQDVTMLFDLGAAQAHFDPWTVAKADFQRGA